MGGLITLGELVTADASRAGGGITLTLDVDTIRESTGAAVFVVIAAVVESGGYGFILEVGSYVSMIGSSLFFFLRLLIQPLLLFVPPIQIFITLSMIKTLIVGMF